MTSSLKPYRKNVGIIVFNRSGEVLAGERVDSPGSFQFPQGGIDSNESPLEAARRELQEETGLLTIEAPIFERKEWLSYLFPSEMPKLRSYCGQTQKWFYFFWEGDPSKLKLDTHQDPEFRRVFWYELGNMIQNCVPFKKTVYQTLAKEGKTIIQDHLKTLANP